MKDFFEQAVEIIREKQEFVIVTVLSKSGPAPCEAGVKMLIKKGFSSVGSVGGGILESMIIKASSVVFETKEYIIRDFALSDNDSRSIKTISGAVQVLLEYINPFDGNAAAIFEKAAELRKNENDYVMITRISEKNGFVSGRDKWICTETGFYGAEVEDVQSIIKFIREDFRNIKLQLYYGKDRYLIEPIYKREKVYVIGAGHIGKKVAELTADLGFYTVVIDDRVEFANRERFPAANEIKVISSYDQMANDLAINPDSYVAIITRGQNYDREVLSQVLRTNAKYIGMIGSLHKRENAYNLLREEGFSVKDLERVSCPVGLNILAQTSEEIAISIVAEMIFVRRGGKIEKK